MPSLDWQKFTCGQNACVFRHFAVDPELIRSALITASISTILVYERNGNVFNTTRTFSRAKISGIAHGLRTNWRRFQKSVSTSGHRFKVGHRKEI
jgi:hypothetical protein